MENNDNKYIATALIWIGAGIGIGLSNVNSGDLSIWNALISISIALGATLTTLAMWTTIDFGKSKRDHQSNTADDYGNLLLQLMTDEERQAMRKRLINNVAHDGELVSTNEGQSEKEYSSH